MNTQVFFTLTDGRLLACAGTEELMHLELAHDPRVFERLNVPLPPSWPPELNDDDSFGHFLTALRTNPEAREWGLYYLIDLTDGRHLVGCGGFVSAPGEDGVVEIGYSIIPECQRRGYATGLCRLLIAKGFADSRVKCLTANTYPELIASIGVLQKCGFSLCRENADRTVTYSLPRPED